MDEHWTKLILETRRIGILLELRTNQAVAQQGLSGPQAHMLRILLRQKEQGTSLTAIHRAYGYAMPTLSGVLKGLCRGGFVRVEPCPQDQRRKLLFPTEKGTQLEQALDGALDQTWDRAFQDFTPEELQLLGQLQGKLLRNLSGSEPGSNDPERRTACETSATAAQTV